MSRFADPSAVKRVELGPCDCKGQPHAGDWVDIRTDLSGSEVQVLIGLSALDSEGQSEAIAPFIAGWNLLGPDGSEWPVTPEALFLLKGDTARLLGEGIAAVLRENLGLPNRSSAPSRASSRGSASRTRTTTRTPGT